MDEAEWLQAVDPEAMLRHLGSDASERKVRLFMFACVRRFWNRISDPRLIEVIRIAERHTDGEVAREELGFAVTDANRARTKHDQLSHAIYDSARYSPGKPALFAPAVVRNLQAFAAKVIAPGNTLSSMSRFDGGKPVHVEIPLNPWRVAREAVNDLERSNQCRLLRDIFGNVFRPISMLPEWLTPEVISLANSIYQARLFERLPELAALLENSGCTNAEILDHCRQCEIPAIIQAIGQSWHYADFAAYFQNYGEHVRGCWVIDSILGKT
jgi:hypothetical protein